MYDGLLGLHSLFRWLILIFLIINIANGISAGEKPYTTNDRKWALRLLVATHINIVIGLFQYFFGAKGYTYFDTYSFNDVLKDPLMRFWAVEHISGMLLAAILITIGASFYKRDIADASKHKRQTFLFFLAFVFILAVIPWPFRPGLENTPWFRGISSGI